MQKKEHNNKRSKRWMETGGAVEGEVGAVRLRTELERHGGEPVGEFAATDGDHRCFLAFAGDDALLYDLPPWGPALCLAWVGGALGDARAEAKAVFASYAERAAAEGRPLCRAVRAKEVERLRASEGEGTQDGEAEAPGGRRAA